MTKEINTKILGGWLILVQAYIIFNTVVWLKDAQLFYGILDKKDYLIAALGNNPNLGLYKIFIYFEFISSIFYVLVSFALFFIFFKRSKYFPKLMIALLALQIITETFSYFYFGPISGYQENLLQKLLFSVVIAAAMGTYLVISKRVKLTFIV